MFCKFWVSKFHFCLIPYTPDALRWHLSNNVIGLTDYTIDNIIKTCNDVNKGKRQITDDIMIGCPIYEMLDDLKIDYNA